MALRKRKLIHEHRVMLMALLAGLPGSVIAIIMLIAGDYTPKEQWTYGVLIVGFWFGCTMAIRERVASPLRTLANLLEIKDYPCPAGGCLLTDPAYASFHGSGVKNRRSAPRVPSAGARRSARRSVAPSARAAGLAA